VVRQEQNGVYGHNSHGIKQGILKGEVSLYH
jgi:hypothetical protein